MASPAVIDPTGAKLRLLASQVLCGSVTPGLRSVSVAYGSTTQLPEIHIEWQCVFESQVAKDDFWEELSAAATEVVSDYPGGVGVNERYLVCPSDNRMEHLQWLVFLRWEPGA